MTRFILAPAATLALAVLGAGCTPARHGIERSDQACFGKWEKSFRQNGRQATYRAVVQRFDVLHEQDQQAAHAEVDEFRRFCKLNQCLDEFEDYWDDRDDHAHAAHAAPAGPRARGQDPAPSIGTPVESRVVQDPKGGSYTETLYRTPEGDHFLWIRSDRNTRHAGTEFGEWMSAEDVRVWQSRSP